MSLFKRIVGWTVAAMILAAVTVGLYWLSRMHYLLFHGLVETFTIVVACGVFMIAWHARRFMRNGYLQFLGIASAFTASLHFLHMLAYKGMPIFGQWGYDSNLPTQLWVAVRYLFAGSMLAAVLFIGRNVRPALTAMVIATVAGGLAGSIFLGYFPDCLVEGAKPPLTPFKNASEYVICAMLLLSGGLLLRHRKHFDRRVLYLLLGATGTSIIADSLFTSYSDVYGLYNFLGHLSTTAAMFLVYQAIIATGLEKPYHLLFRELKDSEESLRQSETRYKLLVEKAPDAIVVHDKGIIMYINPAGLKLLGVSEADEIIGRSLLEWIHADDLPAVTERLAAIRAEGDATPLKEFRLARRDGLAQIVESTGTGIMIDGKLVTRLFVRDITLRKRAERALAAERGRLGAIFQSAPEAIVVVDTACRVILTNPAAEHVIGRPMPPGSELSQIAPHMLRADATAMDFADLPVVHSATQGVTVRNVEMIVQLPDGRRRDLLVSSAPVQEGLLVLLGAVMIVQDVTAQREIERERQRLVDALKKVRSVLELRVQERTSDLVAAISALQEEIAARLGAEAERRRLEAEVLRVSELERQAIGHDLHDGLGQNLTGTAFLSSVLKQKLLLKDIPEANDAAEIEKILGESVEMARSLARGLSPVGITSDSLVRGLQELATRTRELYAMACNFHCDHTVELEDPAAAMHLYRIAQEAINNAFKHGKASQVDIELSAGDHELRLGIEDNGLGIPGDLGERKGMGLRIMNYRANSIGAALSVTRRQQGGTAVVCRLPLATPEEAGTESEERIHGN